MERWTAPYLVFAVCLWCCNGFDVTVLIDNSVPVNEVSDHFIGATSSPPWGQLHHAAAVAKHIPLARLWSISETTSGLIANLTWWAQSGTKVLLNVAPTANPTKTNVTFHLGKLKAQLMEIRKAGVPLYAIEIGNEPNCYGGKGSKNWWTTHGMELMASYYHEARNILDTVWASGPSSEKPLLTGPGSSFTGDRTGLCGEKQDLNQNLQGFKQFLSLTGKILDVVTWHFYPGCSGCSACPFEAKPSANLFLQGTVQQPGWGHGRKYLDLIRYITPFIRQHKDTYSPKAKLWVTETGSLWNGGLNNASNAFAAGFFWLDELGYLAANGHHSLTRQILWENSQWNPDRSCSGYQLVSLHGNRPATPEPDFLSAVLWDAVMGRKVLNTTSSDDSVHVYAHCARGSQGGIVLAFLNTDQSQSANLEVTATTTLPRVEFVLTADNLHSHVLLVTGKPWEDFNSLPEGNKVTTGKTIVVPPASYGFIHLEAAKVPACSDE